MTAIEITAGVGILLCIYALYVERKAEKNASYKAVCDINDQMSCSAAFRSPWGKTFGVQNPIWGLGFYVTVIGLALYGLTNVVLVLAILSLIGSAYLAYILYFKLKNFCLVCNAIYVVNILIFVFTMLSI